MAVWCVIKGFVSVPHAGVLLRKLANELLPNCGKLELTPGREDIFTVAFEADGTEAANHVQTFATKLRSVGIRSELTVEIRFFTHE